LLVLAALSVLPLTQVEAQRRSRSEKDSSATAYEALGAAAGLGGGLLSLLGSRGSDYDGSADGWCVGSCGAGTRNGFGIFLTPGSSQGNARGGASSLLLRAAPARRAMLLETLDDALTRAGLRLVGGNGHRIWFGTDGTNPDLGFNPSTVSADAAGNGSLGGTGASDSKASGGTAGRSSGTAPSNGCIIASCMLGEGSSAGGSLAGTATSGSGLDLDGTSASLFGATPSMQALEAADVNTIMNPEPGTIVLMVGGLAGLALVRRRTRGTSR
jgi:hypothetical protein